MNVTTLTGVAGVPGSVDGVGAGGGGAFMLPTSAAIVTTGSSTVLYVVDKNDHRIRKLDLSNNSVTTYAGTGVAGTGGTTVATAQFDRPESIVSRGSATLYVSDTGNSRIQAIDLTAQTVTTLISSTTDFVSLSGLALSPDGQYLYAGDTIDENLGIGVVHKINLSTRLTETTISGFSTVYSLTTGTNAVYVASSGLPIGVIDAATDAVSFLSGAGVFSPVYGIYFGNDKLYVGDVGNYAVKRIDLPGLTVTTIAGGTSGNLIDGTGPAAGFPCIESMTGVGNLLYITDTGNRVVRTMDLTTNSVRTIAGAAIPGFKDGIGPRAVAGRPEGIVSDGTGTYLFFTDRDYHTVRRVDAASGAVVTLTGKVNDAGTDNGTLSAARFSGPSGIAYDNAAGVLYIADAGNNSIRTVDPGADAVTTLALAGPDAVLNGPTGMALAGGTLYFSDTNNNVIKSVPSGTTGGTVSVIASSLSFSSPTGIAIDGTKIYVADTGNHRIVSISSGTAVVLAGSGTSGASDGTGSAAMFNGPVGLSLDAAKTSLYVVDSGNGAVRRIDVATGKVQTVAGGTPCSGAADGKGSAAQFCTPLGIVSSGGKLFITDAGNSIIRRAQ